MQDKQFNAFCEQIPGELREPVASCIEYATAKGGEDPARLFFILSLTFAEVVKSWERKTGEKLVEFIPFHSGTESEN